MATRTKQAKEAVKRAVKLAGGPALVAQSLGCQPSSVYFWISGARNISPNNAAQLSKLIDNAVKPEQMCPDFRWPHLQAA
jgi:DNA-binding transcriptional regulator YdaS (Cro superfamily)